MQADFQGVGHYSFIQQHKELPNTCSFTDFTSQTNLTVI